MFTAGTYVPCLFWAHLTIEKLAKALWVKENVPDIPPFTHNISKLLTDTSVVLTPAQAKFVQQLNTLQLEGCFFPTRISDPVQGSTGSFTSFGTVIVR